MNKWFLYSALVISFLGCSEQKPMTIRAMPYDPNCGITAKEFGIIRDYCLTNGEEELLNNVKGSKKAFPSIRLKIKYTPYYDEMNKFEVMLVQTDDSEFAVSIWLIDGQPKVVSLPLSGTYKKTIQERQTWLKSATISLLEEIVKSNKSPSTHPAALPHRAAACRGTSSLRRITPRAQSMRLRRRTRGKATDACQHHRRVRPAYFHAQPFLAAACSCTPRTRRVTEAGHQHPRVRPAGLRAGPPRAVGW